MSDDLTDDMVEDEGAKIPDNVPVLETLTENLGGAVDALLSDKLRGIATGFPRTDRVTGGLRNLVILAGAPGIGKSTWALALALNVSARKDDTPVLYYSLEMSRLEMVRRALLASAGDIGTWKVLRQSAESLQQIQETLTETARKLYLWDNSITPAKIRSHVETMKKRHATAPLVVVDHARLVSMGADYRDQLTRQDELLSELMEITRETGATVLLVSELRKEDLDEPSMRGVKGSVSAIYNAQIILGLQAENPKEEVPEEENAGTTEGVEGPKSVRLYVLKNRDGRSGLYIPYSFDGAASRFTEKKPNETVDINGLFKSK
jgi:replicative DNA helicase